MHINFFAKTDNVFGITPRDFENLTKLAKYSISAKWEKNTRLWTECCKTASKRGSFKTSPHFATSLSFDSIGSLYKNLCNLLHCTAVFEEEMQNLFMQTSSKTHESCCLRFYALQLNSFFPRCHFQDFQVTALKDLYKF